MTTTPDDALDEVGRLVESRRYQEAEHRAESMVRADPGDVKAWIVLAQLRLQTQRAAAALQAADAAVDLAPHLSRAHYLRGRACKAHGKLSAAAESYLRAARYCREPRLLADILTSLGVASRAMRRPRDAAAAYHLALSQCPEHMEAKTNLIALQNNMNQEQQRDYLNAAEALKQQLVADAEAERALALSKQGKLNEALDIIRGALESMPATALLLAAAGQVANASGKGGAALLFFDRLLQLEPDNVSVLEAARAIAVGAGLPEGVRAYSKKLLDISPSDEVRVGMRLSLPAIQDSLDSILETRRAYETAVDALLQSDLRLTNSSSAIGVQSFFLAYHGLNDRELQVKTARLFAQAMPSLHFHAPARTAGPEARARIRIGFISRFFYQHSIGKTSLGLVQQLDRGRFEVFVIRLVPAPDDEVTAQFCAAADHVVTVDTVRGLEFAQRQLADLALDVLFYQEVGLDTFTYFLAFARIAPVQCVSYGHPNTTGIPNVDYFVSNDLYESDASVSHYSERLFLLHDLPTLAYYYRPPMDATPASRDMFGLPGDANIYVCPQTLFKMHPEFDRILAGILRRDPRGRIILIRAEHPEWVDTLTRRFERTLPDVAARILFLPSMPWPEFLKLLSVSDVMLDTLHFNGMNTSLEGFAMGMPIVTLPTALHRGRHTRAMYLKMGIDCCIAEDSEHYVDIAVQLGTNRSFNQRVRRQILAKNGTLYEDVRAVREFERFFESAVATGTPSAR
jgi:protein O-GlcNAc transferase